jgi:hypothetical protein
MAAILVEM